MVGESTKRISAGLITIVLLLHIISAVLYQISDTLPPGYQENWGNQAAFLIAVSCVFCLFSSVSTVSSIKLALLLGQVALFSVGLYGEAGFSVPIFAWGAALIIQGFIVLAFQAALVTGAIVAVGAAFFPRADSVWNTTVSTRDFGEILAGLTFYGLIFFLAATYTVVSQRESEHRRARTQLQNTLLQLTSANVGFQNYAIAAEQRGTEEERQRITREIHDMVGYTLTSIIMVTKASEELIERDHATLRRLLRDAREQCQEALMETRRTLRQFRAITTPEVNFTKQIWKTVTTFESATGVRVQLEFRNLPPVRNDTARLVLHRTIQEGLTNAFRHGHASNVSILFWNDGEYLSLVVRDDGVGNPKFQEDIGLRGMRERFEPLGGMVQAQSLPGSGFEVRGWIPIEMI